MISQVRKGTNKAGHNRRRTMDDKVLKTITMPLSQKNPEPQNHLALSKNSGKCHFSH